MNERTILVDFMYFWNRLFYAYSVGNNPEGYYAHAKKAIAALDKQPYYDRKFIILDGRNCSQRHKKLLPSYKEGREPKTSVYRRVDELIAELSSTMKTVQFQTAHEYEADEVIASWVKFLKKDDIHIYSGDKDLIQLTKYPNVHIGDSYSNKSPLLVIPFSEDEMTKKMGKLSNDEFTNYREMLKFRVFKGDASDKIPPAIPRLQSKIISKVVEFWDINKPLTGDELNEVISNVEDTKLRNRLYEAKSDILRNYELMNLIHINHKEILKNVKVLKIKR